MERTEQWFEYQMERLGGKQLWDATEILKSQKDFVLDKSRNFNWEKGSIPFLAIVPHQYLKKIQWTCVGGRPMPGIAQLSYVICRKNDMRPCAEVNLSDAEVTEEPQVDPYWIFGVNTGYDNVGEPQDKVLAGLWENGRRLLTLSETAFLTLFTTHSPFEGVHGIEVPFDLGTSAMMARWVRVKPISRGEISSFAGVQPSARVGIFRSERLHPRLVNYFSNEGGTYRGTPSCTC